MVSDGGELRKALGSAAQAPHGNPWLHPAHPAHPAPASLTGAAPGSLPQHGPRVLVPQSHFVRAQGRGSRPSRCVRAPGKEPGSVMPSESTCARTPLSRAPRSALRPGPSARIAPPLLLTASATLKLGSSWFLMGVPGSIPWLASPSSYPLLHKGWQFRASCLQLLPRAGCASHSVTCKPSWLQQRHSLALGSSLFNFFN